MSTRGSYGILHGDNLLVTYQHDDMYPGWWGYRLARDAYDNRERACEIGEASKKAVYCQYSGDWKSSLYYWEKVFKNGQTDLIHENPRFHYCFHRPGATEAEVSAYNLHSVPATAPSFSQLAYMEEVFPEEHMPDNETDRDYHYTWVTSPRNLFVASTEWVHLERWRSGPRTVVFDLESDKDLDHLGRILSSSESFAEDLHPRMLR